MTRRSVSLIASGMTRHNQRLQPWRYLNQVARGLAQHKHSVTIISDSPEGESPHLDAGVQYHQVRSVASPRWRPNSELNRALKKRQPDLVLWHLGLTALLYQRLPVPASTPAVGIFTSPIYTWKELKAPGWRSLLVGRRLCALHLLSAFLPGSLQRHLARKQSGVPLMVAQTEHTRQRLLQAGVWSGLTAVIPPAADTCWYTSDSATGSLVRRKLGWQQEDPLLLYFGAPDRLRGLRALVEALVAAGRRTDTRLRLLILSRRSPDHTSAEESTICRVAGRYGLSDDVRFIRGFLRPEVVRRFVSEADVIALPFQLVPSDAPLSLLEARAMGKPIVTTRLACLPELVSGGPHFLAEPGDIQSLASALLAAVQYSSRQPAAETASASPQRTWDDVGIEWSELVQSL